jgi:archaellum component FlaC
MTEEHSLPPPGRKTPETNTVAPEGSAIFGPFGLLRSPLFFICSVFAVALAGVLYSWTANGYLAFLVGLAALTLVSILCWQYLSLSKRLEQLSERSADLYRMVDSSGEQTRREIGWGFGNTRNAHGYTHKLLRQVSGDQSRALQSADEQKKAIRVFFEQLRFLTEQADTFEELQEQANLRLRQSLDNLDGRLRTLSEEQATSHEGLRVLGARFDQLRESSDSLKTSQAEWTSQVGHNILALNDRLTRSLASHLDTLKETAQEITMSLHEAWKTDLSGILETIINSPENSQERLLHQLNTVFGNQGDTMASALEDIETKFGEIYSRMAHLTEEVDALSQNIVPVNQSLEVATAVDRLNLEMRRQIAELRQKLS